MSYKPPSKHQRKKLGKFLGSGEEIVFVTSIGKRYFWLRLFFIFLLPLALAYASILMILGLFDFEAYTWIKYLGIFPLLFLIINIKKASHLIRQKQSYTYALTNRRFLIITGIFSRKIVTAPLERITHVTVEQSIAQRYLFGNGHLVIITAGYDQREIVIENVANPVSFKILIEELMDKTETAKTQDQQDQETPMRALNF